jgi:predicted nucleic acid-binding Zn ribbon protein
MRVYVIITVVGGLFLSFGIASATVYKSVEQAQIENLNQTRQEFRKNVEAQIQQLKFQEEKEQKLEQKEGEIQNLPAAQRVTNFKDLREKFFQERQIKKEELEARVKEMREANKKELEAKKKEFREKLSQILQERHKKLAENLSERINKVNQNMSDAALRYLEALELVLSKIETRVGIVAKTSGISLTSIQTEIDKARQKIEESKEAVLLQKSKEYVIEIRSQDSLGQDIRTAFQKLASDQRELKQNVLLPTRKLVHDVMQKIKTIIAQKGAEELLEQEPVNQPEQ